MSGSTIAHGDRVLSRWMLFRPTTPRWFPDFGQRGEEERDRIVDYDPLEFLLHCYLGVLWVLVILAAPVVFLVRVLRPVTPAGRPTTATPEPDAADAGSPEEV
jgi:hypothetical protein